MVKSCDAVFLGCVLVTGLNDLQRFGVLFRAHHVPSSVTVSATGKGGQCYYPRMVDEGIIADLSSGDLYHPCPLFFTPWGSMHRYLLCM